MLNDSVKLLRAGSARETATDCYLITMLGIFPLFPGWEGYVNITAAKFWFFLIATGLWLLGLLALTLFGRERGGARPRSAQWAGLAMLAILLLSWLCSPWRAESFLGAGRYDGLLSWILYLLVFLGVSRFTVFKRCHAAALAAGAGLCCLVGTLQLFGLDPLRLFPGDLTFYDSGVRYSGAYLGTIGNTNILDAVLALALPLCAACWLQRGRWPWLLPLVPGLFVVLRAGGGGIKAALAACALVGMPLLLTELPRVRRALRLAALAALIAAVALAYAPDYGGRVLHAAFSVTGAVWAALLASALLLALSLVPPKGFAPSPRGLRRFFALLSLLTLAAGALLVWLRPGTQGTAYELHEILRGHWEDGYGSSRIRIWRECLALAPERLLLGGGPGTLGLRLDIQFSRYVEETGQTLRSYVDNAHNIFLGVLLNEGVLGLAAYLATAALSLRSALRRGGPGGKTLVLALLGGLVHALFGLGLCLSEPVFWALLGLAAANKEEIG